MSNSKKHNNELFSMRSLESAYLPHMFSEHENAHKQLDPDGSDSFDSISTSHKRSQCSSGDISIVDAQYSHRVSPYNVTKDGMSIFYRQLLAYVFTGVLFRTSSIEIFYLFNR